MKCLVASVILVAFASAAHAQAFDKGTYNISGAVAATNNNCGFQPGAAVDGYIIFPGDGKPGFALALPLFTAPAQVSIANAFPPVPAGGLNGWNTKATFTSFTNGAVSQGPFAIIFTVNAFVAVANNAGQASVTITGPACTETLNLTLLRTGNP